MLKYEDFCDIEIFNKKYSEDNFIEKYWSENNKLCVQYGDGEVYRYSNNTMNFEYYQDLYKNQVLYFIENKFNISKRKKELIQKNYDDSIEEFKFYDKLTKYTVSLITGMALATSFVVTSVPIAITATILLVGAHVGSVVTNNVLPKKYEKEKFDQLDYLDDFNISLNLYKSLFNKVSKLDKTKDKEKWMEYFGTKTINLDGPVKVENFRINYSTCNLSNANTILSTVSNSSRIGRNTNSSTPKENIEKSDLISDLKNERDNLLGNEDASKDKAYSNIIPFKPRLKV